METIVKAPSNIKIAGEHSVVYGGPSLSAAIELYATATVNDTDTGNLQIELKDLGISASFSEEDLRNLYEDYSSRDTSTPDGIAKYIAKHADIDKRILPYATIASRLLVQQGINAVSKSVKVTIHSDVPVQKGYASSAVCSTSFAVALITALGKRIDDQTAIDIARDGERIIHKAEGAGRIDVGPAYFGGYATFSASNGVQKQDISAEVKVVVIDTGPKPPTAEMVAKVRSLYNSDKESTEKTLKEIDACVISCIDALKRNDQKELGKQMSRNHELLKKLGVSSAGLDRAVDISKASGAYGAKLCGGGGGGMGIALVGDRSGAEKVIAALKKEGFDAYSVSISLKGAKG
jgi:mevalonate kinase